MPIFSAEWIVPMSGPPVRNGFITIDRGRIQEIGSDVPREATALGAVAILPALVNAHTHLELSFLCGRVPPSDNFNEWVTTLMALRREAPDPNAPAIVAATRQAIEGARATGTGLIGDISNTLVSVKLLREAGMAAHVFHEQIGFNLADVPGKIAQALAAIGAMNGGDDTVRMSVAAHAPYSVSPALFGAIRRAVSECPHPVTSVHLGESAQEIEFLRDGTGPARVMLERLGVWTDAWHPPGVSPVAYLDDLAFLDARTLVVHGVQFDADDLARLAAIGATLVSCPRSNAYVGAGSPPLTAFYESGVDVAFGTDSLTSVADLNMFNELAEARRIASTVPARRLLESATLVGARALGFERDYGSIEVGKRAALLAVRVPAHVADVEQYLVGGVDPDAIAWLPTTLNA
jgi:cytosine/adenosine deaminase-related metal-dependent hydrolase